MHLKPQKTEKEGEKRNKEQMQQIENSWTNMVDINPTISIITCESSKYTN